MKFKLGGLKAVEESLVKLIKSDLPIRMSYQMSKLYDSILAELTKVEEFRVALVKKYGETGDKGEIKVKQDNMDTFVKEYGELMDVEIDVNFIPVKIEDLISHNERLEKMGHSPVSLSGADISNLKGVGILVGEDENKEEE
jgi:hypothetical protein